MLFCSHRWLNQWRWSRKTTLDVWRRWRGEFTLGCLERQQKFSSEVKSWHLASSKSIMFEFCSVFNQKMFHLYHLKKKCQLKSCLNGTNYSCIHFTKWRMQCLWTWHRRIFSLLKNEKWKKKNQKSSHFSITLTKTGGFRKVSLNISLCHWRSAHAAPSREKTKCMNFGAFNTAALLFLDSSGGSQSFSHLGKKPLSETPAKPDILLWRGCKLWAAEKQTPRRRPPLPRLFRRCRCHPADTHSLISCTCQEGLSSKTAACVLLICWLQIMNFKWRLAV